MRSPAGHAWHLNVEAEDDVQLLVEVPSGSGANLWINPDHVRSVHQAGPHVVITFSNGDDQVIQAMKLATVLTLLMSIRQE